MRAANWKDYELIDTGSGERLERWGDILLIRPDPQIIWKSEKKDPRWRSAHARYKRSSTGGGKWEVYKKLPDVWKITRGDLTFRLKPMGFKHTGVFPEQAVNWDYTAARIRAAKEKNPEHEIKILNLFGYTGAATLDRLFARRNLFVFIVFSALLLILVRPLCRRFLGSRQQATNADRIIGQTAVVTEPIDNVLETGAVKINGKIWTARSTTDAQIAIGTRVTVVEIRGVKAIVKPNQL